MAVNQVVETLAKQMAAAFDGPMTSRPIEELRELTAAMITPSTIEVGSVDDHRVSAPDRDIPIRIYRPSAVAAPRGVLLWLHGGGFALGGLALGDDLSRRLCEALQVAVVNVDYAVSPEHPFPAGLDDCVAVYQWIRSGPRELDGCVVDNIAVAGESAGGNLAMVLSMVCRDRALTTPTCQVSVYGTAECTITNPELGDLPFLTSRDAEWFWSTYTSEPDNPYVAPARAVSQAGLPPLFAVTAEHDPTRDGTERYVDRVRISGGVAAWKRYPKVHHGFFGLIELLPEAQHAFDDVVTFLDEHLGHASSPPVEPGNGTGAARHTPSVDRIPASADPAGAEGSDETA